MNLQILENTTVGKIPPILTMNDGTPVTDRATWEKRRAELTELAVGLQFGGMPPEPEFLEVEPIDEQGWGKTGAYRVTTGRKDAPISFTFYLSLPATPGDYPVIVDGDLWTPYIGRDDILPTVRERGAIYAVFNRVEIAPDNFSDRDVALYAVYPGLKFSGLAAWAWGYARTTDALIKMGLANTNRIVYTGHSRGGKAALLAGVTDPRAVIVNPTGSGCGGMGLYHVHCRALTEEGKESRDERLDDIIKNFGYWFSADLADYVGRDGELPFDHGGARRTEIPAAQRGDLRYLGKSRRDVPLL